MFSLRDIKASFSLLRRRVIRIESNVGEDKVRCGWVSPFLGMTYIHRKFPLLDEIKSVIVRLREVRRADKNWLNLSFIEQGKQRGLKPEAGTSSGSELVRNAVEVLTAVQTVLTYGKCRAVFKGKSRDFLCGAGGIYPSGY